jgi:hypothetical protein
MAVKVGARMTLLSVSRVVAGSDSRATGSGKLPVFAKLVEGPPRLLVGSWAIRPSSDPSQSNVPSSRKRVRLMGALDKREPDHFICIIEWQAGLT